MPTGARTRRIPDVVRMGQSMSFPGIDPRAWVCTGRVDDDADAIRWVDGVGLVADVTITGGPLDGQTEVPCRVASDFSCGGGGEFIPLARGCQVQVLVNGGSLEEGPVIIGRINDRAGNEAPMTVNGLPITGSASSSVSVSPMDTEILVSAHNRREEYAGETVHQAAKRSIVADAVNLGSEAPSKSVPLGEDFANEVISAITEIVATYGNGSGPVAPTPATAAKVATATQGLLGALSQKVKVE